MNGWNSQTLKTFRSLDLAVFWVKKEVFCFILLSVDSYLQLAQ